MDKKVILIVDDDKQILRMFVRRLKKLDMTIHTAVNGKLGLDLARSLFPDIVIMDIRMPVMDGYEMVRTLRAEGYDKLIIACSASVRAKDSNSTLVAGCDYFISKPVGIDFEKTVQKLFVEYYKDK